MLTTFATFLAMPRGLCVAWAALCFLTFSAGRGGALGPVACLAVAPGVTQGQFICAASVVFAAHGVTSNRHVFSPRVLGVGRAGIPLNFGDASYATCCAAGFPRPLSRSRGTPLDTTHSTHAALNACNRAAMAVSAAPRPTRNHA
jgi:hypothetical protein